MPLSRKQLGERIRAAREAKGLTVREAAKRLDNMDPGYYSRMETGQYAIGKHARSIAKLYGFNSAEFEALAGAKLPSLRPYLRAKYDLDDEAIAELESAFEAVAKKRRRGRS